MIKRMLAEFFLFSICTVFIIEKQMFYLNDYCTLLLKGLTARSLAGPVSPARPTVWPSREANAILASNNP